MFRSELKIFFTAIMFYTRIPCPKWVGHEPEMINKATRYFPLIGWIAGALCFAVYYAASFFLSAEAALVLSMIAGVLLTGAFHEDGFADVCDGFGGGWNKKKILEIMKDSRVGAYGVIGLILLFLLKFFLLMQIVHASVNTLQLLFVFVAAHSLSRTTAVSIVFTEVYVRDDDESKSKPIAQGYSWKEVTGAFVFGLIPLLVLAASHVSHLMSHVSYLISLICLFFVRQYLVGYYKKWIGGYTGDCLGAAQQIAEVVFYISLLGIWKFI